MLLTVNTVNHSRELPSGLIVNFEMDTVSASVGADGPGRLAAEVTHGRSERRGFVRRRDAGRSGRHRAPGPGAPDRREQLAPSSRALPAPGRRHGPQPPLPALRGGGLPGEPGQEP